MGFSLLPAFLLAAGNDGDDEEEDEDEEEPVPSLTRLSWRAQLRSRLCAELQLPMITSQQTSGHLFFQQLPPTLLFSPPIGHSSYSHFLSAALQLL